MLGSVRVWVVVMHGRTIVAVAAAGDTTGSFNMTSSYDVSAEVQMYALVSQYSRCCCQHLDQLPVVVVELVTGCRLATQRGPWGLQLRLWTTWVIMHRTPIGISSMCGWRVVHQIL
jgi:hypothetical protein